MSTITRKCTLCARQLPVTSFYRCKDGVDGFKNHCKDCQRERWRRWYEKPENRARHIKHNGGTSKKIVRRNQQYLLDVLRNASCADCGNDDVRVMEFDHVRGEKVSAVAEMISAGYSIARIQAEIEKCEIVCANCHRIRTGTRASYFRHVAGD